MNKLIRISSFVLATVILNCSCSSYKTLPTAEVNYISGDESTITMRSIGFGPNEEDAIFNAEINSFDVVLFRGLPKSAQKIALIGTNESVYKEKYKDYFNSFYSNKRFKTFLMSSIPSSALTKYKGGQISIAVDVKINLVSLRIDLEENNIIRKFGF